MYMYRQFHVWLLVIPFWVLHVFGASSILSKYDAFGANKKHPGIHDFLCDQIDQDNCYVFIDKDELKSKIEQNCLHDQCCKNCLHSIAKGLKKLKKHFISDIAVCDNRIDNIDKKFNVSLCAKDIDINDISSVTIA